MTARSGSDTLAVMMIRTSPGASSPDASYTLARASVGGHGSATMGAARGQEAVRSRAFAAASEKVDAPATAMATRPSPCAAARHCSSSAALGACAPGTPNASPVQRATSLSAGSRKGRWASASTPRATAAIAGSLGTTGARSAARAVATKLAASAGVARVARSCHPPEPPTTTASMPSDCMRCRTSAASEAPTRAPRSFAIPSVVTAMAMAPTMSPSRATTASVGRPSPVGRLTTAPEPVIAEMPPLRTHPKTAAHPASTTTTRGRRRRDASHPSRGGRCTSAALARTKAAIFRIGTRVGQRTSSSASRSSPTESNDRAAAS